MTSLKFMPTFSLILASLLLTACESMVEKYYVVPSAKSKITIISDLVETNGSTTSGFDAAEWFRNEYGLVVDTASFIYPELQIYSTFETNQLHISAQATGMVKFDGALNQNRIDKVDLVSNHAATSIVENYSYFLGNKHKDAANARVQEKAKAFGLLASQALVAYELALEEALTTLSEARIPGKNAKNETKVFTLSATSVKVLCAPLENYVQELYSYSGSGKYYGGHSTVYDLVAQTGCIAKLKFAVK